MFDWCSKSQRTAHMVVIWMSKYALFSGFITSLVLRIVLNSKALGLSRICDLSLLCSVGSAQENRAIGESNGF